MKTVFGVLAAALIVVSAVPAKAGVSKEDNAARAATVVRCTVHPAEQYLLTSGYITILTYQRLSVSVQFKYGISDDGTPFLGLVLRRWGADVLEIHDLKVTGTVDLAFPRLDLQHMQVLYEKELAYVVSLAEFQKC
jgi:hypothetical protein